MNDNLQEKEISRKQSEAKEDNLIARIKSKMEAEEKFAISEEVAIDTLADFLSYYEVDPSDSMSGSMGEVVRAIRKGQVSITKTEKGVPVVTQILHSGATCKWSNSLGAAKSQFSEKDGHVKVFERIYILAGGVTGLGEAAIKTLPPQDLRVIEAVAMLFLAI